ncbi:MAG: ATPase, T2SS/T4P/T4SS family [Candidatus Omnitrophota bacterium]|nr:Flp pilus assembly complex ATPase component TadA [Candidatus Omnitrophota bacterium]
MGRDKYLRLGEILVKEKILTERQLAEAIAYQKKEGGRLGEVIIKLGLVNEEELIKVLGMQLGIPYLSLGTGMLKPATDQGLETLVPYEFAIKNLVFPLSRNMRSLTIAMVDPLDLILIDNLKKITACEINPVITTRSDITMAIESFYGKSAMFKEAVNASYQIDSRDISFEDLGGLDEELSLDKLVASAEEAPVIKLVDLIIQQAIGERASDIHIEPLREKISIRYRIDGKLCEVSPPAKQLYLAIISRIKILAKLDIAEKRLPQDGAFIVRLDDRVIDLRVSTIPTIHGEKVVLRILDKSQVVLNLNQMGFEAQQIEQLRHAITLPFGLVLVTGPTGSGKTTTLYAMLSEINTPDKNIITVEDPVEYKMDGVNQVQVKPEIGLTFASALRSFLRQDPNVMLVGEIRDLETAEICIRSALTGHLVLSTLHTNDAASAIIRLVDIGIESYLLTPSLICVIAQRLVRKLCPSCKEAYEPNSQQLGELKLKSDLIYKLKGCSKCNSTGYLGRICISEIIIATQQIKELIGQKASSLKIKDAARLLGMKSLRDSAIQKVEEGVTSLEEAISVTLEY